MRPLIEFFRQEEAATAVEYAVMLAMVLLAVIGAIGAVGGQTSNMWGDVDSKVSAAFKGE